MSETITQVPGAQGAQGAAVPADGVNPADLKPVAGSLVTDLGKSAAEPGSLVTDLAKPGVSEPAKNADGTDKTPEQIAADAAAEAAKKANKVVPDAYEIKFKVGDKEEPADPAAIEAFTPIAKELGLTQEAAQKLATFHQEQTVAALSKQVQFNNDTWARTQAEWQAAARADPEYGHLAGGKTFEENGALIAKGLATFGTPALNKALVDFGMGNHPEFARFFYRVGKAVSEDSIRVGSSVGSSGAPKDIARIIFPTMTQ